MMEYLEKLFSFLLSEVFLQDVKQPVNDSVVVVETSVVLCVLPTTSLHGLWFCIYCLLINTIPMIRRWTDICLIMSIDIRESVILAFTLDAPCQTLDITSSGREINSRLIYKADQSEIWKISSIQDKTVSLLWFNWLKGKYWEWWNVYHLLIHSDEVRIVGRESYMNTRHTQLRFSFG